MNIFPSIAVVELRLRNELPLQRNLNRLERQQNWHENMKNRFYDKENSCHVFQYDLHNESINLLGQYYMFYNRIKRLELII